MPIAPTPYFEFPFEKLDDVNIELPSGWQVASLPPARNQDGHVVVYSLTVENAKGMLHLTRKLDVDLLLMDSKYYPAVAKLFSIG